MSLITPHDLRKPTQWDAERPGLHANAEHLARSRSIVWVAGCLIRGNLLILARRFRLILDREQCQLEGLAAWGGPIDVLADLQAQQRRAHWCQH